MGRRPIIREAILKIMKDETDPLEFKQIRQKVAKEMGRSIENIAEGNIDYNLKFLIEKCQVEKIPFNGKYGYILSNAYFKTKNKILMKNLIDGAELESFCPNLEDVKHLPVSAYFEQYNKIVSKCDTKETYFFSRDLLDWNNPIDLICRRMIESFTDLSIDSQLGIKKLLGYAYWFGIQSDITRFDTFSLKENLERSRKYAEKYIQNDNGCIDDNRVNAERIKLKILDITEEIFTKKNLQELLLFLQKRSPEIKALQNQFLTLREHFMATGEQIFDNFLNFHEHVLTGLQVTGLVPKNSCFKELCPQRFRYILNYGDVWNEFIPLIFHQVNDITDLQKIDGNLKSTMDSITKNKKYLWQLLDLPIKSKMFVFYVWGYPEIFKVSDKEFLPMFADWFSALKKGYLDHRKWIFEEKSVMTLIDTFKKVKQGKIPKNGLIDIENWTILGLYQQHPQGKDLSFWKNFLIQLKKRMDLYPEKHELCRHINAVLDGRY